MEKEKKDRLIGGLVTVGFHGAVILLFMFILAWKQPFPPKPEYGIEINIGLEQEGSGTEQPKTVSDVSPENQQEEQTETLPAEEESQQEIKESVPETPPENKEPVPEEPEKQPEENIPDSHQEESPVAATPEVKKDVKEEPVREIKEERKKTPPEEKPEKPVEKVNPPVEKPAKKETINKQAIYTGKKGGNQGETKDAVGDAGKQDGTIDARSLHGKQGGGGGGPRLDLPGWKWDFKPNPKDTSKESGKIIFEIKVDEQGNVIAVNPLEYTVNPDVLQIYRKEVERLTFSPTSSNTEPPPVSKGKITFIIRAK